MVTLDCEGGGPRSIAVTEVLSKTEVEGRLARRASNARVRFAFSVM